MSSFLRQRRIALNMSQGDLAEVMHVSQQTIARWESSGQIPSKYMKDLAVVMGARPAAFLPRAAKGPARQVLHTTDAARQMEEEDDDGDELPYGTVRLQFMGSTSEQMHSYPIGWDTLNHIQDQLGDVGRGFNGVARWIQFEALNNKWVTVNAQSLDRASFVPDDDDEMPFFVHADVYKAAYLLRGKMPTDAVLREPDYPYTAEMVKRVEELNDAFMKEGDDSCGLRGVTVRLLSGEYLSGPLKDEIALSLNEAFGHVGSEGPPSEHFLTLAFRDDGIFEHVRLGAVQLIEASLVAFNKACEGEEQE